MKKLLIGLLILGSISSFAQDKLARCEGKNLILTVNRKGFTELTQNGVKTIHTAIIGADDEGYPHITNYELQMERIHISDEDSTHIWIKDIKVRCRADFTH